MAAARQLSSVRMKTGLKPLHSPGLTPASRAEHGAVPDVVERFDSQICLGRQRRTADIRWRWPLAALVAWLTKQAMTEPWRRTDRSGSRGCSQRASSLQ